MWKVCHKIMYKMIMMMYNMTDLFMMDDWMKDMMLYAVMKYIVCTNLCNDILLCDAMQ